MTRKKKKSFINKFNHQPKGLRIAFLIIGLIYIVSLVLFTRSILSLEGIETAIRVTGLVFLYILLIVYFFGGVLLIFTEKKKRAIVLMIFIALLSSVEIISSYYIDKTYNLIDKVQKKYVEYTSTLIALNDTDEYKKIGMINSTNDPTGYVIPEEMIKEHNIDAEIIKYDDYISMITALYDNEIDAMFTANNYVTMFNSYERFENIEDEVKVVYEKTMELENVDNVSYSTKKLTEPFTLLLMGVDSTGDGLSKSSSFNGDTLMLITFNPKTLSSTVFSIPRDTFVPISCYGGTESKINSSAYGGTSCVVKTIENLTNVKIDYYVKINFTGVVNLVDDLGGIEVDVPIKFCEQDSKRRKSQEYQLCLEKGLQTLNGEQALALARHRKTLPLGDFQRVQHQQLVVEAMVESLKKLDSVDAFYKILDDVTNNIDTNMTTAQILSLYQVGKNVLTSQVKNQKLSITRTYLTGYDLYAFVPSMRSYVYTFQYYKQSLNDIIKAMKVNLELEDVEIIKTFSFDANVEYKEAVVGKTFYNEEKRSLLPNFVGKSKSEVETYANSKNLKVNYVNVFEGDKQYNENIANGYVANQKEHHGIIVENLSEITIYINNNTKSTSTEINTTDDTLPDFIGMTLTDFNKWKSSLKNVNLIINVETMTPDDALLGQGEITENTIYKQSADAGTKISDISKLTVYYYKKIEIKEEEEEE